MKSFLTIVAWCIMLGTYANDTTTTRTTLRPLPRNVVVATADQPNTQKVTISTDTNKKWKQLYVVPTKDWTWWDYTKLTVKQTWDQKPYLIILLGFFLLTGIYKLLKLIFK